MNFRKNVQKNFRSNHFRPLNKNSFQNSSSNQFIKCQGCGGNCTYRKNCKAFGKSCLKCGRQNHFVALRCALTITDRGARPSMVFRRMSTNVKVSNLRSNSCASIKEYYRYSVWVKTLKQDVKLHIRNTLDNLQITREIAKMNQEKSKESYDRRTKEPQIRLNQMVLLQQFKTPVGKSPKLIDKYDGPYYISHNLKVEKLRHS